MSCLLTRGEARIMLRVIGAAILTLVLGGIASIAWITLEYAERYPRPGSMVPTYSVATILACAVIVIWAWRAVIRSFRSKDNTFAPPIQTQRPNYPVRRPWSPLPVRFRPNSKPFVRPSTPPPPPAPSPVSAQEELSVTPPSSEAFRDWLMQNNYTSRDLPPDEMYALYQKFEQIWKQRT